MNINRIIGYVLLFLGLALIAFALYQSWSIFSGTALPPQIFKVMAPLKYSSPVGTLDLQAQLNDQIQKQITQMIPPDTFSNMLNLFSFALLATILMLGGTHIASLGIKLLL